MEFFCPMFFVIRGPIRRNKDDFFLETHLGEMSRKEFGHSESANAVRTENLKLKKKKMLKIQEDC